MLFPEGLHEQHALHMSLSENRCLHLELIGLWLEGNRADGCVFQQSRPRILEGQVLERAAIVPALGRDTICLRSTHLPTQSSKVHFGTLASVQCRF